MKRLLTVLAVFAIFTLRADERSAEILDKLSDAICRSKSYRIDFVSTVEGHRMQGYYTVSGNDYRIHTPETDIFCSDGVSYQIDDINREIVIEPTPESGKGDILPDPANAFSFLDRDYSHTFAGQAKAGGKTCYLILLKGKTDRQDIRLYVDTETSLPVRVEYFLENINSDAVIEVEKFSADIGTPQLVPDLKRYKYYEIIDFRQ